MRLISIVAVAALALAAGCREPSTPAPPPAAGGSTAPAAAATPGTATFRDRIDGSGIDFAHRNGRTEKRYLPETMGSGVAVLDYDADGRQDLYFVDGGPIPADADAPGPGANRLYRNLGGWRFEDATAAAGVPGRGVGMGAAVGDVDGDGDADLFVTGYRATTLYLNDGDGTFTDATRGDVADAAWTTGAAFLDFDADGNLDLFIQRYAHWSVAAHAPCHQAGKEVYCTPDLLDPVPNRLLRGRGDGTFEDVSASSGIGAHPGKGLGVVAADLDADGDTDIYCANDTFRNFLFENVGAGKFRETGLVSGSAYGADGREEAGMGTDAGDVDGDGLPDLVVTNFENEPNNLYRNEGGLSFTEISALSGLAVHSRPRLGWGVRIADMDLDGRRDVVVANGHVYDNASDVGAASGWAQPGQLLLGTATGRFEEASPARAGDLASPRGARGLATADLDDDGDLDLVVTSNGGRPALLENLGAARSWIGIRCVGTGRDGTAIGTRVSLRAGGRAQVAEVHGGGSYLSQSDLRLVFGLGDATSVDEIEVTWPGGARETATAVAARRHVTFVEGSGMRP